MSSLYGRGPIDNTDAMCIPQPIEKLQEMCLVSVKHQDRCSVGPDLGPNC